MRYLSVCSGIEAASVAWEPLGWKPVGFSEIEPFPSSVLAHRFPGVPNLGDMTRYKEWNLEPGSIDILVGGTPCQSFSVAGRRGGLEDPRGQLMYSYIGIAKCLRPRWIVWENVPGVLSSNGGRDFGALLKGLGDLGYGLAWRVLDAQWCRVDGYEKAVPQRRRRVFVIGCLGDAQRASQVLFERESVQRDPAPRRKAGQATPLLAEGSVGTDVSATVTSKWEKGRGGPSGNEASNLVWWNGDDVASTFTAESNHQRMPDQDNFHGVVIPLQDGRGVEKHQNGIGIGEPNDPSYTLDATGGQSVAVSGTLCGSGAGCDRASGQENELDFLVWPAQVAASLGLNGKGTPGCSNQEIFSQNASGLVPHGMPEVAGTLLVSGGVFSTDFEVAGGLVPYDRFQITAPVNRQNLKPGDPCHTLARDNADHAAVVGADLYNGAITGEVAATMGTRGSGVNATGPTVIGFSSNMSEPDATLEVSPPVKVGCDSGIGQPPAVAHTLRAEADAGEDGTGRGTPLIPTQMSVRRLTPRECERLQGFPDDWTLVPHRNKPAADGPRYKAIGNSMAVNVMRWIGTRIEAFK